MLKHNNYQIKWWKSQHFLSMDTDFVYFFLQCRVLVTQWCRWVDLAVHWNIVQDNVMICVRSLTLRSRQLSTCPLSPLPLFGHHHCFHRHGKGCTTVFANAGLTCNLFHQNYKKKNIFTARSLAEKAFFPFSPARSSLNPLRYFDLSFTVGQPVIASASVAAFQGPLRSFFLQLWPMQCYMSHCDKPAMITTMTIEPRKRRGPT